MPLFNLLGYESAAAVSAAVFLLGAPLFVVPVRTNVYRAWASRSGRALLGAVFPLILLALNARAVPNCAPWTGALFYLLIVVGGIFVASAWGVAVASVFQRRWLRISGFYFLVAASLLSTGLYLLLEPPVVAGNAVIGYFAGSIYDEALTIPTQLVAYRAWNLVFAAFLLLVLDVLTQRRSGKPAGAGRLSGVVVCATAFVLMSVSAEELGMWRTRATIAADLGGVHETEHFVIHYDLGAWHADEIESIGQDHEFRHHQLAPLFGAEPLGPGERVRSFIYRDREQKGQWLGIRNTLVAKIWLGEIHIQYSGLGDPLLLHELAHAYSAPHGAAGLGVSVGSFGLPNIGLVEGYAEAVVGRRGESSLHGWTAAMRRLGIAPDIRAILRPDGFYSASGSRAYTVAGSFSQFLLDEHGPEKWRAAYARGDFEAVYGQDLDALVQDWEQFVDGQALSDAEIAQAEFVFSRPSIFERRCARYIAEVRRLGAAEARDGAWPRARLCYQEVMYYTPQDPNAALDLATAYMKLGEFNRAGELIDRVLGRDAEGRVAVSRAYSLRGDLAARHGSIPAARAAWAAAAGLNPPSSTARLLEAKRQSTHPRGLAYFHGDQSPARSMYELSAWVTERPNDGLGHYLLGRRLWGERDCLAARPHLARAAQLGLPAGPLTRENLRLRGICALRTQDLPAATRHFESLGAAPDTPSGLRREAAEWQDRIRWQSEAPEVDSTEADR